MTPAQAFLNRIEIASPCSADWAEMAGDDRARFCAQCEKHVYDLSTLTAEEAVALIEAKEGALCVRLWRRADGTVLTSDCPVGAKQLVGRRRERLSTRSAALLSLAMLTLGCAGPQEVANTPKAVSTQLVVPADLAAGQMITGDILMTLPDVRPISQGMISPSVTVALPDTKAKAPQVVRRLADLALEPAAKVVSEGSRRGIRMR
jgi:hypothetical protein